jgi:TolB-like protein/Flp pilus assembly protein TadD
VTPELTSDPKFEIGHVLFIDIVGYSRLLISQQSELLQCLKQIVSGTEEVRMAEAQGKLLRLPTGDGGALVFRNTAEAPVQCALQIAKALKSHPELRVRMGIHSGPVNEVADLNERMNVAGAGINIAQRVMDCGDAGHILLSKHVAEDLENYARWQPYLHDLGECQVKHGGVISIVNFYSETVGNPELPQKFKAERELRTRAGPGMGASIKRSVYIGAGCAVALIALGLLVHFHQSSPPRSNHMVGPAPPSKSVAVLPFENLSRDQENAYFAEGIQEEILTRLSKIADLKVISRTSTQRYKSSPANLREIANELGVANILEGSVQRAADQVRVNVQLIKAASDAHLWADTYDRRLTDTFAIESEIAKTIADTLQARLSSSEQEAVAARPTQNTQAHQLYLKGRYFWNKRTGPDFYKALDYFNQAIREDPSFALAYAGIASTYVLMPMYGEEAPQDCWPKAESAAKKALELDETLAEAHTALGGVLGQQGDFEHASEELHRAIQLNPNYATAHHWLVRGVLLPLGQFDDAIAEIKRAIELDPFSLAINASLGVIYTSARRYDEAILQLQRTLELDPNRFSTFFNLGNALELKGDHQAAIAAYQKARQLSDDPSLLAYLAYSFARAGQREEALKLLAQLNETARDSSKRRYLWAFDLAIAYLGLGDTDEALRLLEKSYENREGDINEIRVNPFLDSLRGDPRFEQLLAKVFSPGNSAKAPEQPP